MSDGHHKMFQCPLDFVRAWSPATGSNPLPSCLLAAAAREGFLEALHSAQRSFAILPGKLVDRASSGARTGAARPGNAWATPCALPLLKAQIKWEAFGALLVRPTLLAAKSTSLIAWHVIPSQRHEICGSTSLRSMMFKRLHFPSWFSGTADTFLACKGISFGTSLLPGIMKWDPFLVCQT